MKLGTTQEIIIFVRTIPLSVKNMFWDHYKVATIFSMSSFATTNQKSKGTVWQVIVQLSQRV